MKVRDALGNPSGVPNMPHKDDRRISPGKEPDFRSQLSKYEGDGYQQELENLVNEITRQGKKFSQKIDISELRVYKRLISEFLDAALGKSRKFSKHSLLDRRGRHKVYALVKKINNEIEKLTEEVIKDEKDNIEILKRLDDIRGLILDMVL